MNGNMQSITELINLLGEKNIERLQERIIDIICNRIEDDINHYDRYIFYPPDYDNFFGECYTIAMKKTKKQLIEKMQEQILNSEITNKSA